MKYKRMPIEIESPEQMGYNTIKYNLSESSYTDQKWHELTLNFKDLIICYGDHIGHLGLRHEIIKNVQNINVNDVLITTGAASALFIIHTSILNPGDELVVAFPNYGTNLETPRAIGAHIKLVHQNFENGFRIDLNRYEELISDKTKLVSITTPHNPSGVMISESDLKTLIKKCEKHGSYLLVDETYRQMNRSTEVPMACSLSESVITVSSLSKTFGLPGIRIGWIMTKNKKLQEMFLAAKEQIIICNSVIDEEIAYQFMLKQNNFLPNIKSDLQQKYEIVEKFMENHPHLEWVAPTGGCVAFPRIKQTAKINVEKFYSCILKEFNTYVGPGHWFEMDDRYFRLGFGWPTQEELKHGLNGINSALKKAEI